MWIPDNPVRFIDAFVDSLALAGAGFERAEPKETGRPGYDPSDLLKLYIYGYLNRVRSSRRLEAETHRLIAEQQVHSQVSDLGLLAETGRAARTSLGVERIDAVADKGYFKVEDIAGCEAAGITPYVPKPRRSPARRSGRFPKERFRYDAEDTWKRCG